MSSEGAATAAAVGHRRPERSSRSAPLDGNDSRLHVDRSRLERRQRRLGLEAQAQRRRLRRRSWPAAAKTPTRAFRVNRTMINFYGTDNIVFRAENQRTGEVCRAIASTVLSPILIGPQRKVRRLRVLRQPGRALPADRASLIAAASSSGPTSLADRAAVGRGDRRGRGTTQILAQSVVGPEMPPELVKLRSGNVAGLHRHAGPVSIARSRRDSSDHRSTLPDQHLVAQTGGSSTPHSSTSCSVTSTRLTWSSTPTRRTILAKGGVGSEIADPKPAREPGGCRDRRHGADLHPRHHSRGSGRQRRDRQRRQAASSSRPTTRSTSIERAPGTRSSTPSGGSPWAACSC